MLTLFKLLQAMINVPTLCPGILNFLIFPFPNKQTSIPKQVSLLHFQYIFKTEYNFVKFY